MGIRPGKAKGPWIGIDGISGPVGGGIPPFIAYWTGAATLGSGPVKAIASISALDLFWPDGVYAVFGNTANPAAPELRINGSAITSISSISARDTLEITGDQIGSATLIRISNAGGIDINAGGANQNTTIRGDTGIITLHNATDESLQMRERITVQGLVDNAGSPYAGGSITVPTTINLGAIAGSVVRLSPVTQANSYYILSNPKNWQVVFVHVEASVIPARVCVGSAAAPNMYVVIPGAQSGSLQNANMAALQWNPNSFNGTGSWVQVMVRPQPITKTLTDAVTILVDANDKDAVYTVTLGGNRTLGSPTGNFFNGQKLLFMVRQDGVGGRTLAYGASYRFSTDLPSPTLSLGANKLDYLGFVFNATDSKWDFIGKVFGFN